MYTGLKMSYDGIFGLAFDIEKADTKSGFRPAPTQLGTSADLFGDLRLEGFAAMLRIGFTKKITIFGGNEARYKDELPIINRAAAIGKMLVDDFDIEPERVDCFASSPNTVGNVEAMKAIMTDEQRRDEHFAACTSHYHIPRAKLDIDAKIPWLPIYSAEAFILAEDSTREQYLLDRFGGGPLAERLVDEIAGIAKKIRADYQSGFVKSDRKTA